MTTPGHEQKLIRLVRVLREKTAQDEIEWERRVGYNDDEEYRYSTTTSTSIIHQSANNGWYSFTLLNSQGLVIGRLSMTEHSSQELDDHLESLHSVVRGRVLQIDETIDNLLSDLESDDEPPF